MFFDFASGGGSWEKMQGKKRATRPWLRCGFFPLQNIILIRTFKKHKKSGQTE